MADILIRMEMPKTCGLCQLCLDDSRICNGYCMFFHRRVNMMERDKNCPLVPLPEGHGRLGDLTEIEKKLQKTLDAMGDRWLSSPSMMAQRVAIVADLKKVKEAPTVIPEEGGMDDG